MRDARLDNRRPFDDAGNPQPTFIHRAFVAAQAEIGRIAADATNPQTRSKYATYGKLDSVLRPIYTRHGFALSFDSGDTEKLDHERVLCHVSHRGGFTRTHHKDMPADGKGAKGGDVMTKTHASGAATSYGMRYLLRMIFNVAIGEEDTDGNSPVADALRTITSEQAAEIKRLLQQTNSDTKAFLAAMGGAASVDELPGSIYQRAMMALNKKLANQRSKNAT